jgi:anti-sigma-K factor RskA
MKASHRNTFDSIPWLVTGRIADDERQSFEKHLNECAECRAELEQQQQIHAAINRDQPRVDYAPGASLQKLLSRIGDAEQDAPAQIQSARTNPRFRMRLSHWLAAAVVVEAVGLTLMVSKDPAPTTVALPAQQFQTVTSSVMDRNTAVLRVVFAPDFAVNDMNSLLRKEKLMIVNGPTTAGVYTLATTAALTELSNTVPQALVTLKAHPGVRFAEPIGAASLIATGSESENRP